MHKRKKQDPKKLSYNELEGLLLAYESAIDQLSAAKNTMPITAHELLLKGHAIEMHVLLNKMLNRNQMSYLLTVTPLQALAAHQLWLLQFELTPHSTNVVRKVVNEINAAMTSSMHIEQRRIN